ncbi:MAG: DUF3592 domain-containing protein [Anaerolineales bacterium]|nr:DUF3592 domain-containing protein [Anaerolineales bacterium]
MFYAFSVLFLVLGLVTGAPAVFRSIQMKKIRQNSSTTVGMIKSSQSSLGWLMTSELGKVSRPLILFHTPDDKEHIIEIIDNRGFLSRRYETGESVDVVYDKSAPEKAYLKREWDIARRDLWKAAVEIVSAAVLWAVGVSLGIPL